ncbi:DoxX family protein [Pontibacter sp. G13]|uniref:DoxX family protein n=1 Tax=Pontibacter sp. G13 TaxID=3074898 RepID=UPI00288BE114|nr:DoxX family protein [Pontibacter sp. G13]WNJ18986.1 DoxX family protein [Pontibacter sp. G13]
MQNKRKRTILSWLVSGMMVSFFLIPSAIKLSGSARMLDAISVYGITEQGAWMLGILELTAAVGLLFPKTRFWSALVLMLVMLGAVGVHIVHGDLLRALLPLGMIGVLMIFGANIRRVEPCRAYHSARRNYQTQDSWL